MTSLVEHAGRHLETAFEEGPFLRGGHAGGHLIDQAEEFVGGNGGAGLLHALIYLPFGSQDQPQLH